MRVAIMGTGGVGGYFGGLLARHGHDVVCIARGPHLAAIRERGLTVRSRLRGDFNVRVEATDDPASVPPVDLVLFCVKSYDTEAAGAACLPLLGPGSAVLTLQNGMDNPQVLAGLVGRERVLGGSARIEATIIEPGVIGQFSPVARVDFGELDEAPGARAERLLEAFRAATWDVDLAPDLRRALWEKFVALAPFAGVTTLADVAWGEIQARPDLLETLQAARRETVEVAAAEGHALPLQPDRNATAVLSPTMKSSMQRDRERGKRIELEALNGTTVRLGREYGVPTPVNLTIYAALQVYDERVQAGG